MNIFAILVGAAVYFILGFLWHGPLFGKVWMKLANITPTGNEKLSDMYGQMFKNYLANVVTAVAFVMLFTMTGVEGWMQAWKVVTIVFIGIIATGSSMDVIWMGKSPKLWLFELSSSFVGLSAMGIVLALFK